MRPFVHLPQKTLPQARQWWRQHIGPKRRPQLTAWQRKTCARIKASTPDPYRVDFTPEWTSKSRAHGGGNSGTGGHGSSGFSDTGSAKISTASGTETGGALITVAGSAPGGRRPSAWHVGPHSCDAKKRAMPSAPRFPVPARQFVMTFFSRSLLQRWNEVQRCKNQPKRASSLRAPGARRPRRNIHVLAAASPRPVSAEYPRPSRGVAATRQRNIHAAKVPKRPGSRVEWICGSVSTKHLRFKTPWTSETMYSPPVDW